MMLKTMVAVAMLTALPFTAFAEATADTATGSGKAVEWGLDYHSDLLSNTSGGVSVGGALVDIRAFTLDMNMQTLLGWTNTRMHINYQFTNGGDPQAVVGAYGVSNLEAGARHSTLYEFWFEHDFSEYSNLLIGLYDFNEDFDVTPAARLFINAAFAMGNDIVQPGLTTLPAVSILPMTSLALRYYRSNAQGRYFQVALLDGDPGNGYPRISWQPSEGFYLALEGGGSDGVKGAMEGKFSYGAWLRSVAVTQDAASNVIAATYDYGLYLMVNGALFQEREHPQQGLAGFMRLGLANPMVNIYSAFTSFGLVYTGLIPGMDHDQLGIAMALSQTSQHYYNLGGVDPFEVVLEISYRNRFNEHFYVQPFTQMIFNPDINPALGDARVYGIRMSLSI